MFGNDGFPAIRHIDEVLPHVEGRPDFAVKRRDGYTAIDYIFAGLDTFDHPIRRECRGIKFGADGEIIARPYHKFFNLGEKPETQEAVIDWSKAHVVLEKLDGSMVHPALVDDRILWMTRAGVTEIADAAATFAARLDIADRCRPLLESGITPIFEWCSPQNQIVVRYTHDRLILTGMRQMVSGEYLPLEGWFDIVAQYSQEVRDLVAFLAHTRDLKDQEGYVVRFNTGAMLKIKADDYVTRHKARDSILLEKNVLRIVVEGAVDDVIPLLAPEDAIRLRAYANATMERVYATAGRLDRIVSDAKFKALDRKAFAIEVVSDQSALWKVPLFQIWQGQTSADCVRATMLKHCGSRTEVDEIRAAMGLPVWQQQPSFLEAA